MRMWNIKPSKMCDKHLLGEHVETHMFVGCLNKNKSVKGYLDKGLLEVHNLRKRHDRLVSEMKKRGMKHKSKLPNYKMQKLGKINIKLNEKDLFNRCKECGK
ncbi:MAG: pyrimidine dimer DNA glycosylase/endonuclease V [Candidatus Pacearchaeota archaeon]